MIQIINSNTAIKILIALLGSLATFLIAAADDWPSVVLTPGYGRIEIVSNYIIFSSGKSYDAKIPKRIQEGARINISYKEDNEWVHSKFDVVGISAKGELCRLHNKLPSRYSFSPGDTIYIKPCRYE